MRHNPENQCRITLTVTPLFAGALVAGLFFLADEALAARDSKLTEQAWACSTLYSRYPIKVLNGESRETALCLGEGKKGRTPMGRGDAWELCREQFDTRSVLVAWTGKGWHCRYNVR